MVRDLGHFNLGKVSYSNKVLVRMQYAWLHGICEFGATKLLETVSATSFPGGSLGNSREGPDAKQQVVQIACFPVPSAGTHKMPETISVSLFSRAWISTLPRFRVTLLPDGVLVQDGDSDVVASPTHPTIADAGSCAPH